MLAPLLAMLAAAAPTGAEGLRVEWIDVPALEGRRMLAAVARPEGKGPFPAIALLHGTHGFAREYVKLAQAIARNGVLAVAACWFAPGSGPGTRFVTPIPCPEAPAMPERSSVEQRRTIEALVQAVRGLPGVRRDAVALFGHSRGGGAALDYLLNGGQVQAAVLDAAGYPAELAGRVREIHIPILILHGAADGPDQGGGPVTAAPMARAFEAALRAAGNPVESHYYPGAGHNGMFVDPAQLEDSARRIAAFARR